MGTITDTFIPAGFRRENKASDSPTTANFEVMYGSGSDDQKSPDPEDTFTI